MKKLISIFIIIISFSACSKGLDSVECESKNTDKGLIESSIDFGTCIYEIKTKKFIIQNPTDYTELQEEINNGKIGSDNCSYPIIDFEKHTLLGQYAQATGCTINFNRNVAVDSTIKQVNYIINTEGCGACEMLGYSYNYVLVKKIDDTYTILFNGESE